MGLLPDKLELAGEVVLQMLLNVGQELPQIGRVLLQGHFVNFFEPYVLGKFGHEPLPRVRQEQFHEFNKKILHLLLVDNECLQLLKPVHFEDEHEESLQGGCRWMVMLHVLGTRLHSQVVASDIEHHLEEVLV